MSGIKGFFLLFMVLGAMYLGAQAEAEAKAEYCGKGMHILAMLTVSCALWNHVQYTLDFTPVCSRYVH